MLMAASSWTSLVSRFICWVSELFKFIEFGVGFSWNKIIITIWHLKNVLVRLSHGSGSKGKIPTKNKKLFALKTQTLTVEKREIVKYVLSSGWFIKLLHKNQWKKQENNSKIFLLLKKLEMTWIRIKNFPMRISASKLNGSYALQGNKLNWIKGNTRGWGEGGLSPVWW